MSNNNSCDFNGQIYDAEYLKDIFETLQDLSTSTRIFELIFLSSKMRGDFHLENGDFDIAFKLYN